MPGEYNQLVQRAQADTDVAHRQLAMTSIATIAPSVGGDNQAADAMAAPVLARLYPPETDPQARIKQIEAEAQAQIKQIIAEHQARAQAGIPAGTRQNT